MSERKDKIKASIGAVIFHLLLLLALIFLGLSTPLPLPEEEGVEVNLGYSDMGSGNKQAQLPKEEVSPPAPQPQQESSSSDEEELVEDIANEAPNIQEKPAEEPKKIEKPKEEIKEEQEIVEEKTQEIVKETPKEVEPEPEPVVDPRLLYTGKKDNTGESAEGDDKVAGDKGKETGDPNSQGYEGLGGQGNGVSYSLGDRKAKSLPKPVYNSEDQGKVVVSIWVNKMGQVTRAEIQQKGTNVTDINLRKMAKEAALKAKFSADPEAAEIQKGSITYHFIKLN